MHIVQSPALTGPVSPIVGTVSCGDFIERYLTTTTDPYFFRLTTTETYDIEFKTCNSGMDPSITIFNSAGSIISDDECPPSYGSGIYGDDCGDACNLHNREDW